MVESFRGDGEGIIVLYASTFNDSVWSCSRYYFMLYYKIEQNLRYLGTVLTMENANTASFEG